MGWQLLINLLYTIGVFLLGRWVAGLDMKYLPAQIRAPIVHETLVWLGVMVLTAPAYLASARKIQAMSMLIAEMCVPVGANEYAGNAVRTVIAQVFVLVAFLVMTFVTVLLSTSILSSVESLLPLLLIVTIAALLFRRMLVRIYSRAEIALHETLVELPRLRSEVKKSVPDFLHEAELDTVEIPHSSPLVGLKLRDIPLRQKTGASIVAIERGSLRLINPGPEEVLLSGDRVLLLGQTEQLPAACDLLAAAQ
jgi:CPA2 family monovalent cation:H+ antiporter-2